MIESNTLKKLAFNDAARLEILRGVQCLADAVKVTMGPRGQNVVIERPGNSPHVTKDGVTVAKAINLRERYPDLGVQMVKEAASRTAELAGDGTTTATVLARAIFEEGLKMIAAGYASSDIQAGISAATDFVLDELKKMAVPVTKDDDIVQVGTISANGDSTIGELLLSAMKAVGRDGIITIEDAKGYKTSLDVVEGCEIPRGFLSPYFVTDQDKMACILENPKVLLINKKITSLKQILPVLERVHKAQGSLLIIADDVDGDALHGLVLNKLKGTLNVCAIRAPEFGESRVHALDDLGILLGCTPISAADSDDLTGLQLSDFGTCKKAIVGKHTSVFVGCAGEKESIDDRSLSIRSLVEDPTLNEHDKFVARRRLAMLAGGVAILRVGAATEIEMRERRDRVDDALNATQAAVEEGILPGGGVALVHASSKLKRHFKNVPGEGFSAGVEIIKKACEAPMRQISENAGAFPEIIVQKVSSSKDNVGYDASKEEFVDMFECGIIDPLKVVRSALENSSSTARMLLSIGCAITEDSERESIVEATLE